MSNIHRTFRTHISFIGHQWIHSKWWVTVIIATNGQPRERCIITLLPGSLWIYRLIWHPVNRTFSVTGHYFMPHPLSIKYLSKWAAHVSEWIQRLQGTVYILINVPYRNNPHRVCQSLAIHNIWGTPTRRASKLTSSGINYMEAESDLIFCCHNPDSLMFELNGALRTFFWSSELLICF